ncbi:MAG: hypothetical protein CMK36_06105 [Porticoccaceae bacterium]|nr:hypothetical protein [Porticoccaceae bacterium]
MLFLIKLNYTQPIPALHKKPLVNMAFVNDKNKTNIIKPIVEEILHTGRLIMLRAQPEPQDLPDSVAACTAISLIISHLADYDKQRAYSFIKDVAYKVGYDQAERTGEQNDLAREVFGGRSDENLDQDSLGEWRGDGQDGWHLYKYEQPAYPNGWEEVHLPVPNQAQLLAEDAEYERIANEGPLEPGKLARDNTRVNVGGNVRRGDKVIIHTLNPHTGSSDERAAALGKLKHKLDVGDLATVSSHKKNGWLRVKIDRTEAVITIRNVTSCSRVMWV